MMECKKALVEANGNIDEAVVVLRKRGLAAAGKKAARVTKQGMIAAQVDSAGRSGVLVEVNCESDFVARTDDFLDLASKIVAFVGAAPQDLIDGGGAAALMASKLGEGTVEDLIKSKIAKLGENMSVARFGRFQTTAGVIGSYIHPGAQLGVLVDLQTSIAGAAGNAEFQELIKDVAMQIAAADPKFLRKEDVTPEMLQKEREIQKARVIADGKPPQVADKIVEGRMAKYYEEVCLYQQPFVKENTLSVEDVIKMKIAKLGENIGVARFGRFKVGGE